MAIEGGPGGNNFLGAVGAGGGVVISGGIGGTTSGAGGAISLSAGDASSGNSVGGTVTIAAGASVGSGTGAAASLTGGAGGATGGGGVASLVGGAGGATSGIGGSVTVVGGLPTEGNGGSVSISARPGATAVAAARSGGSVTVTSGAAVSGGVPGVITFNSAGALNIQTAGTQYWDFNLGTLTAGEFGGSLATIIGQARTGVAQGLTVLLQGGPGGSTSGQGGTVRVLGGLPTDGVGGPALVEGGAGAGAWAGGTASLVGGAGGATGAGGAITITGGAGGATSGAGGAAELAGGAATTSGGGGAATVAGGSAVGTDQIGSTVEIRSGRNTGAGNPGSIRLETSAIGTTGTTLQSSVDRIYVNGIRKALTDNTVASLFDLALPASAMGGARFTYTVRASDGTDFQARTGQAGFSAVNKAGAYTSVVDAGSSSLAASTGTLAVTFTVATGTNEVTLEVTADSSLTPTTLDIMYTIHNDTTQGITIL